MSVRSLAVAASVATVATTAVSSADGALWLSDLLANLRLHLIGTCLALVAYWVMLRQSVMSLMVFLALIVNTGLAYSAISGATPTPAAVGTSLQVLTINVRQSNEKFDRVQEYLLAQSADVVIVQEVSLPWLDALNELHELYPHRLAEPRADNFGIAVLSKRPPLHKAVHHFAAEGIPYIEMAVLAGETPITILGVHLSWPVMPDAFRARNAQIVELSERYENHGEALALCGDLNLSVWSGWYARLAKEGGFGNDYDRVGLRTTWPSLIRWGGLSIDHCLARPGVAISAREVGPSIGSDHLPVAFVLEVAAKK